MLARRLRAAQAAMRQAEVARSRADTRTWVMQRRERTRHLIELGGLVQKAGLVEGFQDDRAALYGALLALGDLLTGDDGEALQEAWRRRGKRTFAMEAQTHAAVSGHSNED